MYRKKVFIVSKMPGNKGVEGETIESRIKRMVSNGEPIGDAAPMRYTERKDGVLAESDVRTDKFDVALENMDKITETIRKRRGEAIIEKIEKDNPGKGSNGKPDTPQEGG